MFESTARRLIEAHFVEGLRPRQFERLQSHMGACRSCRDYYDRIFGFEAAYDGGKAEIERIGAQVFAVLELDAPQQSWLGAMESRFARIFAVALPSAAAAAVLIAIFATHQRGGGFAERGGPALQSSPQILGSCFLDRAGRPVDAQELTRPGESAAAVCKRGGRLKLGYRDAPRGEGLLVFARGTETRKLYPREPDATAVTLEGPTGPAPLPGSFAIPDDAPPGTAVEIVAYFGPEDALRQVDERIRSGEVPGSFAVTGAKVDRLHYRLE